ncbi:hypothetical protein OAV88_01530 [bacterium]|nr:hypothetical protein [bacterium]
MALKLVALTTLCVVHTALAIYPEDHWNYATRVCYSIIFKFSLSSSLFSFFSPIETKIATSSRKSLISS